MKRNDAGACSEFLDQLDGFVYNAGVFYNLPLADLPCSYLDAFSRDDAADPHAEIDIYVTRVFGAFDKFLADGIRDSFGEEQQLLTIINDGVTSACITIPGCSYLLMQADMHSLMIVSIVSLLLRSAGGPRNAIGKPSYRHVNGANDC